MALLVEALAPGSKLLSREAWAIRYEKSMPVLALACWIDARTSGWMVLPPAWIDCTAWVENKDGLMAPTSREWPLATRQSLCSVVPGPIRPICSPKNMTSASRRDLHPYLASAMPFPDG